MILPSDDSSSDDEAEDTPMTSEDAADGGDDEDDEARRGFIWDEYKLLQGKLDRIGDFRFRVKGWAITLVLGLIVSSVASKTDYKVIAIGGAGLIFAFGILERYHYHNHIVFSSRLRGIEQLLRSREAISEPMPARRRRSIAKTKHASWRRQMRTIFIRIKARDVRRRRRRRDYERALRSDSPSTTALTLKYWEHQRMSLVAHATYYAGVVFYILLAALVALAALNQYAHSGPSLLRGI